MKYAFVSCRTWHGLLYLASSTAVPLLHPPLQFIRSALVLVRPLDRLRSSPPSPFKSVSVCRVLTAGCPPLPPPTFCHERPGLVFDDPLCLRPVFFFNLGRSRVADKRGHRRLAQGFSFFFGGARVCALSYCLVLCHGDLVATVKMPIRRSRVKDHFSWEVTALVDQLTADSRKDFDFLTLPYL